MTENRNPASEPPTGAGVAALTARLRELSTPGRAADPAERAAVLADKQALLARIAEADGAIPQQRAHDRDDDMRPVRGEPSIRARRRGAAAAADSARSGGTRPAEPSGYAERVVTPRQAAARIVATGVAPQRAAQLVRTYLDRTSAELGVPVHVWGLDRHDLDALLRAAELHGADDHDRPRRAGRNAPEAADADRAMGSRDGEPAARHRAGSGDDADVPNDRGVDDPAFGAGHLDPWERPASIRDHVLRADSELAARGIASARPGMRRGHLRLVPTDAEEQRREQLARWHHDDHATHEHDGVARDGDDTPAPQDRDGGPR